MPAYGAQVIVIVEDEILLFQIVVRNVCLCELLLQSVDCCKQDRYLRGAGFCLGNGSSKRYALAERLYNYVGGAQTARGIEIAHLITQ